MTRLPSFFLILIILGITCFSSCSRKMQEKKADKKDAAILETDYAKARLDSVWNSMQASNFRRADNTRYFFALLQQINTTDTTALPTLRALNNTVTTFPFTRQTIQANVDRFDASQDSLLRGINELYSTNFELQRLLNAEQAKNDIQAADDSIIILRFLYTKRAAEYNQILTKNKKALQASGEADLYQKVQDFSIPQ
jgi:hypothetical protein